MNRCSPTRRIASPVLPDHPGDAVRRVGSSAWAIGLAALAGCATWSVDAVDTESRTVVVNAGPFFVVDSSDLLRPTEQAMASADDGCALVADDYRLVLSSSSKARDADSGAWWVTHVFRCDPVAPLSDEPRRRIDPYDELRKGRP
ncbi:MAG: hypothetical protein OXG82_08195 [Gammaproteobacteria bacterium]|nr:hypothetical protein [Gammaproteobacteria bacterium]